MKKILIEAYALDTPMVGIGQVCFNLGKELAAKADILKEKYGIQLYFILSPKNKGIFGNSVNYICFPRKLNFIAKLSVRNVDLYHMPHQLCSLKSVWSAKKVLTTVHDINFMYEKTGNRKKRSISRFNKLLRRSDYVNYISYFVESDVKTHFSSFLPSRVIYNGVTDSLYNESNVSVEFKRRLPDNFFFHISSLLPKKNVHLLVEMMKYLPEENLVISGNWNTDYGHDILKKIRKESISNVITLQNISEDEKSYLYSRCKGFFFPSLCEGFGLPPIEAMKFGKPVFLSTLTSLPEVGGDSAFYWKELSPQKMSLKVSEGMELYNSSPEMPKHIRENADRFTWKECAREYIDYYIEILNDKL